MSGKFFLKLASSTIDCIPVAGAFKGGIELMVGKDLITQDELDDVDKALTASSLALGGGAKLFGKLAKNSVKGAKFFRRAETFSKRSRDVCDRVSDIKTFNESDDE